MPSPAPSDGAAVLDAAEQRRWFAEEVQPHESELRGYLRRQFPSVEVDDVVQETKGLSET